MSADDKAGKGPRAREDAAGDGGDLDGDPSETRPASGAGARRGEEMRGTPAFFEYWNQMDFVSWMGARIVESADGHATVYFEPGAHHRGAGVGGRAVTGAVQAYIFDIVTGAAVASLAHGTRPQVTVTLDLTFEHPAYDAPLTFEAHVLSGGRQIFFVDAVCTDSTGRVCSRARAIYRRFERRVTGEEIEQYLKTHGRGEEQQRED
jgi:acyl-coenzyme A thioesterase PaaI-like protein